MNEMTLEAARQLKHFRESTMTPQCPLSLRPVIVHGPNDGYLVVTLGFLSANELAEVK